MGISDLVQAMNCLRFSWFGRLGKVLARQPLLTFLLLGGLLYVTEARWFIPLQAQTPIVIEAEKVERLRQQWTQKLGRAPEHNEMLAVLEGVALEEMLIAEAVARGVHRNDPVVLRRLRQNLEFLGMEVSPGALEHAYDLDMHRHDPVVRKRLRLLMESELLAGARPAPTPLDSEPPTPEPLQKFSFSQIFREQRIGPDELNRLQDARPENAAELSDPFLLAHRFHHVSEVQIARELGPDLARAVSSAPIGRWVGPIQSVYGDHLIWLEGRERVTPNLDIDRVRIERQIQAEKQNLELALADLRARYRWHVESGEE
ncbi:MAG: hypothetical protein EP339_03790 [Gammaproteobacteria bacterium]|nr:MAG: hypothetical protein EP339_03790 [Gammaproteobacteria bacterium]